MNEMLARFERKGAELTKNKAVNLNPLLICKACEASDIFVCKNARLYFTLGNFQAINFITIAAVN